MRRQTVLVLLASLLSLVNLHIGNTDLRVSLGIIVFVVGLLIYQDINPIPLSLYTGIGVFITRLIQTSLNTKLTGGLIFSYSAEIIFYLAYGLFFYFLVRTEDPRQNNPIILLLMICDFGANSTESLVRYSISNFNFISRFGLETDKFMTIFLAAFVRSAIIWIIWRILERYIRPRKEQLF